MISKNVKLVEDTINEFHISKLIDWLNTNPKLTKGELTIEFEKKWSEWLGRKYSVFVNSGSSANLAMIYSLIISNKLRNKNIIVPAVSWVTTVTPAIQLGLNPIMCDCDKSNLGLDINHLESLIKEHKPSCLILVHVLGVPNDMDQIAKLCHENDILIMEDTCESVGSKLWGRNLGTFGIMSSFSFYFGHHMSTIEGGMVSTDDEELYYILLSIRSHGWDRDLPEKEKRRLREKSGVDDFRALYTFYYPGFNLRSTDLQAFLGLLQLNDLDDIIQCRYNNFNHYNDNLKNLSWKISPPEGSFVSNFAYPIITENIGEVVDSLTQNGIECRPLICGSMGMQPFWINLYGQSNLSNAKKVHLHGLYIPNHHYLNFLDIEKICEIINKIV